MKLLINLLVAFASLFNIVVAQDFSESVENPFGINADTTGGISIYTCNFVDLDYDGDIDIIYSYFDTAFNFAYQENIGSHTSPNFRSIEKLNFTIDVEPGIFFPDFADMNNDGLIDIVSFGAVNDSTGFTCTYFENIGNNVFKSTAGAEIGLPGIGYAFGVPEIVDLNQDGDKDLILSGSSLETFTDEADALYYYGQNSSASNPSFTAWFIEPYSFAFMDTFQSAIIRTGDLDLDGDLDFLMNVSISDDESRFMYQENISPPDEKNDFSGPQIVSPFDLPENSNGLHFLEDLDGDGDLDLFVFDDLNILYYENTSCVNTTFEIVANLCEGASFSLNNETYSSAGIYTQMLTNSNGCDSTITLNLTLIEAKTSEFEEVICEGSSYSWNGEDFSVAGEYNQRFDSAEGCDSTVTLNLTVVSTVETSFAGSFCAGGEYTWNNTSYDEAGSYVQNFSSENGCDSIVTLILAETATIESSFNASFCGGGDYLWNSMVYDEAGSYVQNFSSASGCDSIVTLTLTETTTLESSFNASFCGGGDYLWNSMVYDEAGSYVQNFSSASGCDSIVTLTLTETTTLESSFNASYCAGGEYTWNNTSYDEAGSYVQNFSSENGCDSIVTLILAETATLETSFSDSFCSDEEYIWNNTSYNEAGKYMQSFLSVSGCDSIVELDLSQFAIEYTLTQENGTLNLSVEEGSISWINCDTNTEIEGENTNTFTPSENGNYAVKIEEAGCSVVSDCVNVMSSGLEDELSLLKIHLYPNPANDFISIDAEASIIGLRTAIFVNLAGQTLTKNIKRNTIDILDLNPGFYFVKISSNTDTYTRSIIISR